MLYCLGGINLALERPNDVYMLDLSRMVSCVEELMFALSSCAIMLHTMGMRYMCLSPSYGT